MWSFFTNVKNNILEHTQFKLIMEIIIMMEMKAIMLMIMTSKFSNIMTWSKYRWIILCRRTSQHHRSPDVEPGKCRLGVGLTDQQGESQRQSSTWDFFCGILADGRNFQQETLQEKMGSVDDRKFEFGSEYPNDSQPGGHSQ